MTRFKSEVTVTHTMVMTTTMNWFLLEACLAQEQLCKSMSMRSGGRRTIGNGNTQQEPHTIRHPFYYDIQENIDIFY